MFYQIVRIYNHKILASEALAKTTWFIQQGLDQSKGEEDLDSILRYVVEGTAQLWIVYNGSFVVGAYTTQVIDYPNLSTVRIITLAGDEFSQWIDLAYKELVQFAKSQNAKRLDLVGRKGWVKVLDRFGFKEAYTVVVKELE